MAPVTTYEGLLALQPVSRLAGNKAEAARFVQAISDFLKTGTAKVLPTAQQNYLYKLRQKWEKRARGQDLAWMQTGSKPGRKKKPEVSKTELDPTVFGNEDEIDPLLASIMRKYGTPKRTNEI